MAQKPKLGPVTERIKWRDFFESDYLASWDLEGDTNVTFTGFSYKEVVGKKGRRDKCLVAHLEEFDKPMVINITNSKVISTLTGSIIPLDWIGTKVTLYVKNDIQREGEITSGIRVREVLPKKLPINNARFQKMLEAIESGKYDKLLALESFDLTEAQKKELAAL